MSRRTIPGTTLWMALLCLPGPLRLTGQNFELVPGTNFPRVQLTGEHLQISGDRGYYSELTAAQTMSRYGVLGTDLGFPVELPDKILFLFGDTISTYRSGERYIIAPAGTNGSSDSIGYIPNSDLSQCRYLPDLDQQLSQGVTRPSVSAAACPVLRFFTNPSRTATQPVFKPIIVSGLQADESQATFRVPTAGLVHNDRLYVFYTTRMQDSGSAGKFVLQSILARSDQSPASWSDTAPHSFTRLYTVSSHPAIADPSNPPPETGNTGKFIFTPPVVMSSASLAAANLTQGLPPSLQSASNVVFLWGASYRAHRSNLYLAAFALADIDAGTSKWFYYRGNGQWSSSERDAAPQMPTDTISSHSVIWNSALRRFVLLRAAEGGNIVAQFSPAPWGPWTEPLTVFARSDAWARKLLHGPGQDQIVPSLIPIHNANGTLTQLPAEDAGVPYGPNLLEKFTQNPDGSVTLYYTLSTWNPYQVFLMGATFRPALQNVSILNAASFDTGTLAPDAIATLFGSNLAETTVVASSTTLPESLGGITVTVRDSAGVTRPARLFFVSPGQINFLAPTGMASGGATVTVTRNSTAIATATVQSSTVAPALFTANANGRGAAAAYFATATNPLIFAFTCGSTAGSCVPAPLDLRSAGGSPVLVLYGTGLRHHNGLSSVRVIIGGSAVTPVYAGPQNEFPGLDQINVPVPASLAGRGEVDVAVSVNNRPANTVRVAFR